MKKQRKITWKSPFMIIHTVDIRHSDKTEKDYAVIRAYIAPGLALVGKENEKRPLRKYTFLCFKESLLGLFEPDNFHYFDGEIEFVWGSTYLNIKKLYDDMGNRMYRPKEIPEGKIAEKPPEDLFDAMKRIKKKRLETDPCELCDLPECEKCPEKSKKEPIDDPLPY